MTLPTICAWIFAAYFLPIAFIGGWIGKEELALYIDALPAWVHRIAGTAIAIMVVWPIAQLLL